MKWFEFLLLGVCEYTHVCAKCQEVFSTSLGGAGNRQLSVVA